MDCFEAVKTINIFEEKFDLIFIDPPFKEKKVNFLLEIILDQKVLKDNGIIIIHRDKKVKEKISEKFNIIDIRKYGLSKIIFGN